MKTDNIAPSDPIWTNDTDLLTPENLPVIGNSQISSILSTLTPEAPQKAELSKNYAILKEDKSESKKPNLKNGDNNFEDMLYFVCNLCPFLCTKNAKITEHLENAHKNQTVRTLPHLKCPACENVFFHKMSLRSHLIHDHGVGNSDIGLIIQAVGYYANKAKNAKKKAASETRKEQNDVGENTSVDAVVGEAETEAPVTQKADKPNCVDKYLKIAKNLMGCPKPGCKVTLSTVENISYHVNCHKDDGFGCQICAEEFSGWKRLAAHLWRKHQIDIDLLSCEKCTYKCTDVTKLNTHQLIHGDVRAYTCTVCKKAFKNSKQLGNHRLIHTRESKKIRFSCEKCYRDFSDKRQLNIHVRVVHEKIKPFLCNYCGYKSSVRSSLKMHIRQHTGEKPFACDMCSYATSDHNSLRRHKLRHTGKMAYKCEYCSYACIQSSTFKVHLKTKHPGQEKDLMFMCKVCQFRTIKKEIYISHVATAHGLKPDL